MKIEIEKQDWQTDQVSGSSVSHYTGLGDEEAAQFVNEALRLLVNLCPDPQLWSQAVCNDKEWGCVYRQWKFGSSVGLQGLFSMIRWGGWHSSRVSE